MKIFLKKLIRAIFDIFQVLLIVSSCLIVGYGYGLYKATEDRCKVHKKDSVCIVKFMGVRKELAQVDKQPKQVKINSHK